MSSAADRAEVTPPEPPREETHEVVYLAKRPGYTLALAAPRPSPRCLSWERAVVQVHLTRRGPLGACVLHPSELEAFYEDLRGLVAYLRERRGRPSAEAPRAP